MACVIAVGVVTNAPDCRAQQPTPARKPSSVAANLRLGRITGIVIDSLHGRGLADAEILAEGKTVAIGRTDSTGAFSLSGLQPGDYHLTVSHPLLETLGVSLITPHFPLSPGGTSSVNVGVPGTRRLIQLKCKGRPMTDASAVIGRVMFPDSITPRSNIEVGINWTSPPVSRETATGITTGAAVDTSKVTGAYTICGLPNGVEANLEARVAGRLIARSRVAVPATGITLLLLDLSPPIDSLTDLARTVRLTGRVELPNGEPSRGSLVELEGGARKVTTDQRGNFALDSVQIGIQTIRARRLGYQEASVAVDVDASGRENIVLRLKEPVPVLPIVSVTATQRDLALHRVGFDQRSQHSVGHFLTADQIAGKSDFRFTDLLRGIPGLTVGIDKYGDDVVSSARAGGSLLNETHGCVQYFVDGMPWGNAALESIGTVGDKESNKRLSRIAVETARQLNTVLRKSEILGIEVYQGGGAPTYFNQGGHNCATIVIWTTASLSG